MTLIGLGVWEQRPDELQPVDRDHSLPSMRFARRLDGTAGHLHVDPLGLDRQGHPDRSGHPGVDGIRTGLRYGEPQIIDQFLRQALVTSDGRSEIPHGPHVSRVGGYGDRYRRADGVDPIRHALGHA